MGKYQAHRDFTICVSFTRFQPDGFQFPSSSSQFPICSRNCSQNSSAAQPSPSQAPHQQSPGLQSSRLTFPLLCPVSSGNNQGQHDEWWVVVVVVLWLGDTSQFVLSSHSLTVIWSRNYRIKIYPVQRQVSWRVSPASEKQFQDHLMNFLQLSPLSSHNTTSRAQ